MKRRIFAAICVAICVFGGAVVCASAPAQSPMEPDSPGTMPPAAAAPPADAANAGPVELDWVPPALAELSAQAAVKENFTLDRDMLGAAASLMPDSDTQTRQAIDKLDGLSVHLLRFGDAGAIDESAVESIRAAYHLRGWKHLVTSTNAGGPAHDQTTDVWVVMDGINVKGAVVLVETAKSLALVTVAGNISPVDLLHLRGHFGIPRFDGDGLKGMDN